MSALDPIAFLRATPPFGDLSPAFFERAARSLDIGFFPAGTRLVESGGTPLQHIYVIRKGAVRLERSGQTLQILEEGEVFGYTSLLAKKATLDAIVEEDLLAYRIPGAEFEQLLADARFASHFAAGLAERLKHSLERTHVATFQAEHLGLAIETLIRRPPVRAVRLRSAMPARACVRSASRPSRCRSRSTPSETWWTRRASSTPCAIRWTTWSPTPTGEFPWSSGPTPARTASTWS